MPHSSSTKTLTEVTKAVESWKADQKRKGIKITTKTVSRITRELMATRQRRKVSHGLKKAFPKDS